MHTEPQELAKAYIPYLQSLLNNEKTELASEENITGKLSPVTRTGYLEKEAAPGACMAAMCEVRRCEEHHLRGLVQALVHESVKDSKVVTAER